MYDLAILSLFFAAGAALSGAVATFLVRWAEARTARLTPAADTRLRIRATSGMYRSSFLQAGRSVWSISAPLQRDSYVPLRVGEDLVIEAPHPKGALIFRSKVIGRETMPHCLLIQRPTRIYVSERRNHKRWPEFFGAEVKLSDKAAIVVDLSEAGARFDCETKPAKGQRFRVELPWGANVDGWVLDTEGNRARVRFEELVHA
jgi:hypothetical protein